MLNLAFLTQRFYSDYAHCTEILHKEDRPHILAQIVVDGILFGIPFRSNINHPHAILTYENEKYGLDLSKTIIITDKTKYIDATRKPFIRQNEFEFLLNKERLIKVELARYIKKYKNAKKKIHIPRNRMLVQCSTLQYFEEYLPLE